MAELNQKVYFKRSNVSGKTPTSAQLQWGEVAVNYCAGGERLFMKNSSGDVISFLPDHVIIENEQVTAVALTDLNSRVENLSAVTNSKVEKVAGKGLSTNDYTTAEKSKLAGITAGAEPNVITAVTAVSASTTNKAVTVTKVQSATTAEQSVSATKLTTARNITITDGTNSGTSTSFNGTDDVSIKLPTTIKATIVGKADSATTATSANTATKVGKAISFTNSANTAVSFDGSSAVDLKGGIYFATTSNSANTVQMNATTANSAYSVAVSTGTASGKRAPAFSTAVTINPSAGAIAAKSISENGTALSDKYQAKGNYASASSLNDYQKKLTAGTGIAISGNTISTTLDTNPFIILTGSTLPTTGIQNTKIYLLPASTMGTDNTYIEYVRVNSKWEKIGEFKPDVDLSSYATTAYVNGELAKKANTATTLAGYGITDAYTKTEVDNALAGKSATGHTHTSTAITDFATAVTNTTLNGFDDTAGGKVTSGDTILQAFGKTQYNILEDERVTAAALTDLDSRIDDVSAATSTKMESSQYIVTAVTLNTGNTAAPTISNNTLTLNVKNGTEGFRGSQGATGAVGYQGNQGAAGTTGDKGVQGATGAGGDKGKQGSQGATGAGGDKGNQGNQGIQGDKGVTGNKGAQGATGPIGTNGNAINLSNASSNDKVYLTGTLNTGTTMSSASWRNLLKLTYSGNTLFNDGVRVSGVYMLPSSLADIFIEGISGTKSGMTEEYNSLYTAVQKGDSFYAIINGTMIVPVTVYYGIGAYEGLSDGVYFEYKWRQNDIFYGCRGGITSVGNCSWTRFSTPLNGSSLDTTNSNDKRYLVGADSQSSTGATTNTNINVYTSGSAVYATNGFYETSDERKKDFAEDIDCDLDVLSKLPKKYFSWKDDESGSRHIGTSAQEVQKLYPELVSTDEDGCLHLSYDKLSIVALAAIDKLREENKLLREEINAIKKLLNA